jgi:hypothetical protein
MLNEVYENKLNALEAKSKRLGETIKRVTSQKKAVDEEIKILKTNQLLEVIHENNADDVIALSDSLKIANIVKASNLTIEELTELLSIKGEGDNENA